MLFIVCLCYKSDCSAPNGREKIYPNSFWIQCVRSSRKQSTSITNDRYSESRLFFYPFKHAIYVFLVVVVVAVVSFCLVITRILVANWMVRSFGQKWNDRMICCVYAREY